jgi:phosphoribosylglycinamide formyltransferase 2
VLQTAAASAVIYGEMEQQGIAFDGIERALAVPQSDLRLFGKPEAFKRRRMGVALAYAENVETARENAKKAAALVRPLKV